MMDLVEFADILVEVLPEEQLDAVLQEVSNRFKYGCCPLCGEDDVPVDAQGKELERDNIAHTEEWMEVHDEDCAVTLIEAARAAKGNDLIRDYELYLFDLDSTLTESISGNTFPKSVDDRKWMSGRLERLRELVAQGKNMAIVTNQGGAAWG